MAKDRAYDARRVANMEKMHGKYFMDMSEDAKHREDRPEAPENKEQK